MLLAFLMTVFLYDCLGLQPSGEILIVRIVFWSTPAFFLSIECAITLFFIYRYLQIRQKLMPSSQKMPYSGGEYLHHHR